MTSRIQASWLAARSACLAFLHIIIMPTIPVLRLKLASIISNGTASSQSSFAADSYSCQSSSIRSKLHHQRSFSVTNNTQCVRYHTFNWRSGRSSHNTPEIMNIGTRFFKLCKIKQATFLRRPIYVHYTQI